MMRTIAVVALKGGSGKTTIATHIALAAHLRGLATLVVDTDPQGSTTEVLKARAAQTGPDGAPLTGPQHIQSWGPRLLSDKISAEAARKDLVIFDTAAGALEDASEALVLADFAVLVVRPTLLDLHALARTLTLVMRLKKPFTVVLNQAPPTREGVEPSHVVRSLKALAYMRASVCPTIVRMRTLYQTALETGRSAEEMTDGAAAQEIAALWDYLDLRMDIDEDDASDHDALQPAPAQPPA